MIDRIERRLFPLVLPALLMVPACGDKAADGQAMASAAVTPAPTPAAEVPVATAIPAARPSVTPLAAAKTLPQAVVAFRARRDACDHFRGEEPTDAARAAELERKLARTCTGTDKALADLRRHYADDPAVTAALAGYEDQVE